MAELHHIIIIMSMSNGSFNNYRPCWFGWNGAGDVNVWARIRSGTHDRLIKIWLAISGYFQVILERESGRGRFKLSHLHRTNEQDKYFLFWCILECQKHSIIYFIFSLLFPLSFHHRSMKINPTSTTTRLTTTRTRTWTTSSSAVLTNQFIQFRNINSMKMSREKRENHERKYCN